MGDDVQLQRALMASFQSAPRPSAGGGGGGFGRSSTFTSSPFGPQRGGSSRSVGSSGRSTRGTLAKAGIAAATEGGLSRRGATGSLSARRASLTDQGRSEERNFGAEIGTGGRKLGERVDVLPKPSAPSREDLGDGWWRLSGPKSGSFRKAGLHTIAEASKGRPLVCAFESRVEVVRSAVGAECDGDRSFAVEASFKACVDSANARTDDDGAAAGFAVLVGLKGGDSYVAVRADALHKTWTLELHTPGGVDVVADAVDASLKPNKFVEVLVQVRGAAISVESDRHPVFTSVGLGSPPGGPSVFAGAVGVRAGRRERVALKGWRIGKPAEEKRPLRERTNERDRSGWDANAREDAIDDTLVEPSRLNVTMDDVVGLEAAKGALNEAVVLPMLVPELFTGIRSPWRGVLLFGPPGTGKTLLAKAAAGVEGATFFNVSAATLASKHRGESEKLVRALFARARGEDRGVVFFDEVDALCARRGGDGEHEASRRLKTELLTQLDGVRGAAERVTVLAATNRPWDLDDAVLRRLERRVHVPPPGPAGREALLRLSLEGTKHAMSDADVAALAARAEGYSGADVVLACREASMMPMRRLIDGVDPADLAAVAADLDNEPVSLADFSAAFASTKPSITPADVDKHLAWAARFGAGN
ncbi:microtubule-severing ATPase [Aureococcus anophagefferens]|uniref:Microtubule-severing ATPase n=2 Tax=Aureococcus anophagefferens TaxID=44056 RepID=A0ABR1FZF4_AURAN